MKIRVKLTNQLTKLLMFFLFVKRDKRKISTYSRNLLDSNGNFASQNNLTAKRFSEAVELVLSYTQLKYKRVYGGIV